MHIFERNNVVRIYSSSGAVTCGRVAEVNGDLVSVVNHLGELATFHRRLVTLDNSYIEVSGISRVDSRPSTDPPRTWASSEVTIVSRDGRKFPVLRGSGAWDQLATLRREGRPTPRFLSIEALDGEVYYLCPLPEPLP